MTTPPSLSSAGAALAARRRHPFAGALLVLLALVLIGGLYTALTASGAAQATSTDGDPQQVAKGRQLYLEGCSSCHGLNAEGITEATANGADSVGPSLIGVGAAAVDFQVGTGRMPAAQPGAQIKAKSVQYTQDQIDQLAAYVASLAPGPAVPSGSDLDTSNADLQAGGELFRTNCSQCHNFAGASGALSEGKYAPALRNTSARHMWEAMLTGPQSMPVFSDTTMTPDDKRDLIKYVQALQKEPNPGGLALGRLGPVPEGLFLWVVGFGVVTAVAVWIGVRSS